MVDAFAPADYSLEDVRYNCAIVSKYPKKEALKIQDPAQSDVTFTWDTCAWVAVQFLWTMTLAQFKDFVIKNNLRSVTDDLSSHSSDNLRGALPALKQLCARGDATENPTGTFNVIIDADDSTFHMDSPPSGGAAAGPTKEYLDEVCIMNQSARARGPNTNARKGAGPRERAQARAKAAAGAIRSVPSEPSSFTIELSSSDDESVATTNTSSAVSAAAVVATEEAVADAVAGIGVDAAVAAAAVDAAAVATLEASMLEVAALEVATSEAIVLEAAASEAVVLETAALEAAASETAPEAEIAAPLSQQTHKRKLNDIEADDDRPRANVPRKSTRTDSNVSIADITTFEEKFDKAEDDVDRAHASQSRAIATHRVAVQELAKATASMVASNDHFRSTVTTRDQAHRRLSVASNVFFSNLSPTARE